MTTEHVQVSPKEMYKLHRKFYYGFSGSGKFANIVMELNAFLRTNVAAWHLGEKLHRFLRSEYVTK